MALKLEVFALAEKKDAPSTVVLDTMALEEAKLASYDSGYSAGWEDAAAAQSDDQAKIGADLARNLQSLSFTYQEARIHILRAIEPLLEQIVGRLLPELARETLAPIVLEVLMPLAEKMADTPITLVLNPAAREGVEALLEHATGIPLSIVEEPSLGEGQVYLRLGASETHIDLDRATAEIATAVRGFFETPEKERQDG
jgi:flagellar biosynthesis/type III secretory pathway protein FliH